MSRSKITEEVIGKWPSVLRALGVDARYLQNRHGPCPLCEGGKDRYRFDDKDGKGTYFCSVCGKGNGWDLLMKLNGWEFKEAARRVEGVIGTAQPVRISNAPDPAEVLEEMRGIWRVARPLADVRATALWWESRVGLVPTCADIRGVEALLLKGTGTFPAMVALVRDAGGKVVSMHRTFLDGKGGKAGIDEPRRTMRGLSIPKGAAIRIAAPGEILGIAEGLETAVAASILHDVPCWAAISAGYLEAWNPPEGVLTVRIFGDNDLSGTGQAAAWSLAKRLRLKGLTAKVELPSLDGDDWNDVLLRQRGRVAA